VTFKQTMLALMTSFVWQRLSVMGNRVLRLLRWTVFSKNSAWTQTELLGIHYAVFEIAFVCVCVLFPCGRLFLRTVG